jgi:hypothetical protein
MSGEYFGDRVYLMDGGNDIYRLDRYNNKKWHSFRWDYINI